MAVDATTTRPGRGEPRRFPAPTGARLRAHLAVEHQREAFRPSDVRGAARRALQVVEQLGLSAHLARGALDLGGAELDHVWVVADGRVVDVSLPVAVADFLDLVRGYVAGDVEPQHLDGAALRYALEYRVIGDVPPGCRYRGAPILSHRDRARRR